ncbi:DNA repair protein RecO [Candidatus Uhrbacteria bacterium RIFCSPHIGHO2_01_FULL_63_20]|uniref:DNA repair protein RecO n=1 Tax=Candidatus Uhrbacteria bacterium RIFCSPHIGHO2_01_FULL_63_20 TaxID=1802385 RepID=A0A1F7TNT6_9BACT|nr:MAG: DNA repair protein RecO [Candidatus Uhrbacteria bacterium RIFCSPHIGHO2_01_FULL_63_20]
MATLFRTTGIILSRRDHREADRWYSAFTDGHGKVEFLARGGHKPLAKLTPHLEMPAEIDLLLVDGRQYFTVASTDRVRAFPNVYADAGKLTLVSGALHLVDIGTKPHETDPVLYDELTRFLAAVDEAPALSAERSGFLLAAFGLKLLAIIGYRPELANCLACKDALCPGSYRWYAPKGGVVCDDCSTRDASQWFAARPMKDETLKLIRFALAERFEHQLRPHLPADTLEAFHEAVESLIISHFPTIPASSLREACIA